MEGAVKRAKPSPVAWTDALQNKDVLFLVFCFLEPRDIAHCARVNKAFRRATQSEALSGEGVQKAVVSSR